MKNIVLVLSSILMVASCGRNDSAELATSKKAPSTVSEAIVIAGYETAPTNGGINPIFTATRISMMVQAGSNPCMAQGKTFALQQTQKADGTHITLIQTAEMSSFARMCTMEYRPVFVTVETVVRGRADTDTKVIFENYQVKGQNKAVVL